MKGINGMKPYVWIFVYPKELFWFLLLSPVSPSSLLNCLWIIVPLLKAIPEPSVFKFGIPEVD
jgi:hypothetical protein